MSRKSCFLVLVGLAAATAAHGADNEIGFNERFALAPDREQALSELIPGTEEAFFYRAMHAQNTGQLDAVEPLLKQWSKQLGEGERYQTIRRRQALLRYAREPQGTLAFLRSELGLVFNHAREVADPVTAHPTSLDPAVIGFDRFKQRALAVRSDLGGFEESGLERMVDQPLEKEERRDLLQRLPRPDVPGLEALVLAELKDPDTRGFGRFPIHAKLTLAQLEVLREGLPELAGNGAFVDACLRRLQPSPDTDWLANPTVRGAYLNRLWSFAQGLPSSQNSLKACVLYRLLEHERTQGLYDRARFCAYLQLPRSAPYVRAQWLQRAGSRGEAAVNLNQDFRPATGLPPVGNDEPLVRDYLEHLLLENPDAGAFKEWLDAAYLDGVLAETHILYGVGDAAAWSARLEPERIQALKERVEIGLVPQNPEFVSAEGEVALEAVIKNVSRLTVKVFDLDAAAYYREHGEEMNAGIDLDGLVANAERTLEYKEPPVRRHVERFAFPELGQPGVYVVEFVGNGVSSRALIRKGRLRFVQRVGAAGHVFTVLDGTGRKVEGATLWLAGQSFKADADGTIGVPFAAREAGDATVVVQKDRLACLGTFPHETERYALRLGTLLDRESLLAGETAALVLRPLLLANGRPADPSLLQQACLEIGTADVEGIASTQRREGLVFKDGEDLVHTFRVPPRTVSVNVRLTAKVRNVSQNRDDALNASAALDLNGILGGERVADLLLRRVAGGHVVEARGLTGEPLAGRAVNFSFKHRLFREQTHATLQTDAAGRISLGRLDDISVVWVSGLGAPHTWHLGAREGVMLPPALHVLAGDTVVLPAVGLDPENLRQGLSLLGLAAGGGTVYTADLLERAGVRDGRLEVAGLEPGDYRMTFKATGEAVDVRVTRGGRVDATLVGDVRLLEATPSRPLQVAAAGLEDGAFVARLAYAAPRTRVHVIARRTTSGGDAWETYVSGVPDRGPARLTWAPLPAAYVSGRVIGDEARYVLERRYAERFPGNMLERPSLILNPWSRTTTTTDLQEAEAGDAFGVENAPAATRSFGGRASGMRGKSLEGEEGGTGTLDFLPAPARVWANLKPDADGAIRIPAAELGGRGEVLVVAADDLGAAWRGLSLEEPAWQPKDLRLARALDPARPLAERKTATALPAGTPFTVADLPSARVELYDSLDKVFRLFQALQPDPMLSRFAFLLEWPDLKPERRRELYGEFVCHEINFFLYHKDRRFFDEVVRPYVANKRDKTFMDHWLLGADLSPYLAAGEFERLNTLERILLGQRVGDRGKSLVRAVQDAHNLLPPDPEAFDRRFRTAVQSGGLEAATRAEEVGAGMPAAVPAEASPPPAPMPVLEPAGGERAPRERPALAQASRAVVAKAAKAEAEAVDAFALSEVTEGYMKGDVARRGRMRRLYRSPEVTREWVETHYYEVPLEDMGAGLIPVNGFWRDYAEHSGRGPFLSPHLDEAIGTTAERLCALAVLDLPFHATAAKDSVDGLSWTVTPGSHAVVYHQQIGAAEAAAPGEAPLLVVENLFDQADRWRQVGAERIEKIVREEFVAGRVYGAQVVLTNPTGARRRVSLLVQIPAGSLPVAKGLPTRSLPLRLEPYSTQKLEYFFTFPAAGTFAHFPATVAEGAAVVGRAEPLTCRVVERPTRVDRTSWAFVSQNGSPEEVLAFLREQNVHGPEVQLARVAWRLRDAAQFRQVLEALDARHAFDATLWSYGVLHNDAARIREYLLRAQPDFVRGCGLWLRSPLLDVDAEVLRTFEHKEYWPLVNARAHPLGRRRTILNGAFFAQYNRLMDYLASHPALGARERLSVIACLLLQDRVGEALAAFAAVRPDDAETRLQADYLRAYLAFSRGQPDEGRRIAAGYTDHPVARWRDRFRNVVAQADEVRGGRAQVQNPDRREQVQDQLAAQAPSLALRVEGTKLEVRSRNAASCEVRYFPLDIELLFSRQPFLEDEGARLGYVRPARADTVKLGAGEVVRTFDIPDAFRQRNVLIEAQAEGVVSRVSYTPHAMDAQAVAGYGQVRVRATDGGKPVAGAYVKVYARFAGGDVRFYKDGYTDLRGAFDYASLSTDELGGVARFALLVLDDRLGAVVLEAAPPAGSGGMADPF